MRRWFGDVSRWKEFWLIVTAQLTTSVDCTWPAATDCSVSTFWPQWLAVVKRKQELGLLTYLLTPTRRGSRRHFWGSLGLIVCRCICNDHRRKIRDTSVGKAHHPLSFIGSNAAPIIGRLVTVFLPRDAIARTRLSQDVRTSIRPSVTRRYSLETAKHIIKLFHLQVAVLVFPHQTLWQIGSIPTWTPWRGRQMQGGYEKSRFSANISFYLGNNTR